MSELSRAAADHEAALEGLSAQPVAAAKQVLPVVAAPVIAAAIARTVAPRGLIRSPTRIAPAER